MPVEAAGVVYIVVIDGDDEEERMEDEGKQSFRYTRSVLQSTLQLMGCKPRHAFKISQVVFKMMPAAYLGENGDSKIRPLEDTDLCSYIYVDSTNEVLLPGHEDDNFQNQPFESYKKRTTAVVTRKIFLDVICNALTEYKYVGPSQRADLALACRIRERKESVTVLLCGTSGCGKSTLSALLASRLGITRVISTDSIRHMMRSFVDEKQNPLLWASTYHAGECLDPVAVAEAKSRRKAKKSANISNPLSITPDLIGPKQMAVEGFKAQAEMVIDSLDRLITSWEEQKESVVVEGVHLNLNFVMDLMKKHPSIIPFMIYISNEEKHLERFAVRAKYMTLDPAKNKYVKYIRNIRAIQEYLGKQADKHLVPKINNTNVDRSVAAIHATVFSCLRRQEAGEKLYDPMTNVVSVVDEEYKNQRRANSLSSKGMFQLIQHKGSSRHLMALFNTDGSVAKAWPANIDGRGEPVFGDSSENSRGKPVYGQLQIGNVEPVNLQFGNFGISAWHSDVGGTSHTSSVDCHSTRCNSPKIYEGHAKEVKEEESVHGSDEDIEEYLLEAGSDEDLSDGEMPIHEEIEGSVDEESNKTDEEYDDLAIQETEDEALCNDLISKMIMPQDSLMQPLKEADEAKEEIYKQNLDHFLRTKNEGNLQLPARSYPTLVRERHKQRAHHILVIQKIEKGL